MIDGSDTLDPVLDAAARYAPEATGRARAALEAPWTVAVIGRTGAGKTTAVNRLTGGERRVGLGGVTTECVEVAHGEIALVDTPGIDGLDTAIAALGPVLARADAILWIVDGLQPATRTERDLLATLSVPGTPTLAWISRLDLVEPEQHDGIRDRVRTLAGAEPEGGDLRAWTGPLPHALAPRATSPWREDALRRALADALDALDALPALEGRSELGRRLAGRWRERVRGVVDLALEDLDPGQLSVTRRFQEHLARLATEARDGFVDELRDEPGLALALKATDPHLPLPEVTHPDALGVVAAAMGGEHRARVQVRDQGARWLTEGLLALADWIESAPGIDAARQQREADRDLLLRTLPTVPRRADSASS